MSEIARASSGPELDSVRASDSERDAAAGRLQAAAELTAHVTTISAVAYKSRIDILLPPGVRVETGGLGVSTGSEGQDVPLSPNAPVVQVRGYSYKGSVAVANRPAER
jgi:hypothetical protein